MEFLDIRRDSSSLDRVLSLRDLMLDMWIIRNPLCTFPAFIASPVNPLCVQKMIPASLPLVHFLANSLGS